MESFVIKGGQPLSGTIRPAGNKNAALPIVAASLLADEPVVLRNVPHILDVETMLELVASTGATVERTGPNEVRIDPRGLRRASLDPALCTRIRASVLLAAPLLARPGHCLLPPPGGDVIGRRRLDTHLLAFRGPRRPRQLRPGRYEMEVRPAPRGADVPRRGVGDGHRERHHGRRAGRGQTIIRNAACEPHVQDLCRFLVSLGARIDGIGTNLLRIDGVERLGGGELHHRHRLHRGGQLHRPGRGHRRRAARSRTRARGRPAHGRGSASAASGSTWELDGDDLRVPARPDLEVEDDLGQRHPQDRRRALAGVPGRPDLIAIASPPRPGARC